MPQKRLWSETQDQAIATARAAHHSWGRIATRLRASRSAVIVRACELAVPRNLRLRRIVIQDSANRDPLPPGHPTAWAIITAGTLLDGTDYPRPSHS